jgi:hypothetical protein
MYFQQLPRFVFRFVPVRFFRRSFVFNNLSGSFFKITSFCCPIRLKSRRTSAF